MTDFESKRPENGIESRQAKQATYYLQFYVDDGHGISSLKIAKIMAPDVECARSDAISLMVKENVKNAYLLLDVGEVKRV